MDWNDAIGGTAIACGSLAAVAQIVDWLLPLRATSWMRDFFERAWFWLSEQRPEKLLRPLAELSGLRRWIFVSVVIAIGYGLFVYLYGQTLLMPEARFAVSNIGIGLLVSLGLCCTALPALARWVTTKRTPVSTLLRLGGLWTLSALVAYGIEVFLDTVFADFNFSSLSSIELHFRITGAVGAPVILIGVINAVLLAWTVAIAACKVILKIAEFLMLRLAEHPKGPVLGASALLTALGALTKSIA